MNFALKTGKDELLIEMFMLFQTFGLWTFGDVYNKPFSLSTQSHGKD